MKRIVFLDRGTISVELPSPTIEHSWVDYGHTVAEDTLAHCQGAWAIVTNKVRVPKDLVQALPELRLVAVAATGTDVVDIEACRDAQVAVCNVPAYAAESVAEHIFSLLLYQQRSLRAHLEAAQRWSEAKNFCIHAGPIRSLRGQVLGLIGYGAIARETHRLAEAFGMEVLVAERRGADSLRPGRTTFAEVLALSDILSLHCPLTTENRGLVNSETIALMKPGATLVNTARGALVDSQALNEALQSGQLAGACIDVLSQEPMSKDEALANYQHPGLLVTPHCAWAAQESQKKLAGELIANIEAFAGQKRRNRLD